MTDWKVDSDGNLDLVGGNVQIISGIDEVAQRIRLVLLLDRGEWFENTNVGVPWLQQILGSQLSDRQIVSILQEQIVSVPGAEDVGDFQIARDRAARELTITFSVRGVSSTVTVEV